MELEVNDVLLAIVGLVFAFGGIINWRLERIENVLRQIRDKD